MIGKTLLCTRAFLRRHHASAKMLFMPRNVLSAFSSSRRHSPTTSLLMPQNVLSAFSSTSASDNIVVDEALKARIREFDLLTPHPMNLQQILDVSTNAETIKELNGFLKEEFCIRCAERICMLQEKIPNFADVPELHQLYKKHVQSFVEMQTHNASSDFLPVVRNIVNRGQDVVALMCRGMARLVRNTEIDEEFVNKVMNEFLLNRIGSNVLMSQYLAVATGDDPPNPTSIIDPHTNVKRIAKETARAVQSLCYQETGFRPTIKVDSYAHDENDMTNFPFIPPVISFVVQELLKNSAVATAKTRLENKKRRTPEEMTISVIICADDSRVMLHIGDRAGGIPFDSAQHIWSFLYSTKRRDQSGDNDDDSLVGATDLSGYGVGLPLSRLYASYLGGSINLVSLPGYGTHAYVFFPRLPEKMVESVPIRATGWEVNKSYNPEFIL